MNRELFELSNDDTKLLLLIYEMAKSGAITLDSSSSEHAQIMYDYIEYVRRMKGKKDKRQLTMSGKAFRPQKSRSIVSIFVANTTMIKS